MEEKKLAVLFSGGVDSSLAVALTAQIYNRITCLTFKRFGIFGESQIDKSLKRLQRRFPNVIFESVILPIDRFYQSLLKGERLNFMSLSICGLCKLAMHWRTIIYCIDNKINEVCDGSESSMIQYPDQNEQIMLADIQKLYRELGINYFNPVFNLGDKAEYYLFRMGIVPIEKVRGTGYESQIICTQQRIFKKFVDYYVLRNSWERYVVDSRSFFVKKIVYVKEQIKRYKEIEKSQF